MTRNLKQMSVALFFGLVFLAGCKPENDDTKKELAMLKEQLAQQQQREAERNAKEMAEEQARQIEAAREEAYQAAQEEIEYKQMLENEQKKLQAEAKAAEVKVNKPKVSEKLARYPAFVISESGIGRLNLRGAPTKDAVSITELSDGDQVMVVGETNACTPKGCWVKVQVNGMTGYVNNAFLQRGKAPQSGEEGIY
ncbi:SH3 domain-containing protein [Neisseria weaveri]|uniref:SH3 domain-containing protein n=1 Tax=Neisseria weaveri TaxID=28091 RepID=UPI0002FAC481|nr:SH3 domain-containing protein [Neisseria weaveri]